MAKFNVGDHVKVVNGCGLADPLYTRIGQVGVVDSLCDTDFCVVVRFDDGERDYAYASEIEGVGETAPHATTIKRIVAVEVNHCRFERVIGEEEVTLFYDGDARETVTIDEFREIVKALEV